MTNDISLEEKNILVALREAGISWSVFWRILEEIGEILLIPRYILDLKKKGIIKEKTFKALTSINWDYDRLRELEKKGIQLVTPFDESYPVKLKKIEFLPYALFYKGDISLTFGKTIGIVGSRKASTIAKEFTRKEASSLAEKGFVIVSGFAIGIDTEAHVGASLTGKTIAVMGTACDDVYPSSNRRLYQKLLDEGHLIISPFYKSIGSKFVFLVRNEILASLSDFLVVVEAGLKSGAITTAYYAFKMEVPVFAVPGKPWDPLSKGTNRLIKMGATLYTHHSDILGDIDKKFTKLNDLNDLPVGTFTVEEFANIKGLEIEEANAYLMELEIEGMVKKVGPGFYERVDNS